MRKAAVFFTFLFLVLSAPLQANTSAPAEGGSALSCPSDFVNPFTDVNWNNAFPIIFGGARAKGRYPNPRGMNMPAVCKCSKDLLFGIGMSYWTPSYVAEVQNKAGCFPTLAGANIKPPKGLMRVTDSNGLDSSSKNGTPREMHVHWFKYPLFAMLDLFNTVACSDTSGALALVDFTELDPFWKDDLWSNTLFPESFLYANPVAQLACTPDAISSTARLPIDTLTWCIGSQGSLYPVSGRSNVDNSMPIAETNLEILAKFMQKMSRQFRLQVTATRQAACTPVFYPNLYRSQYRMDLMKPVPSNQSIRFGRAGATWTNGKPLNPAKRYDSTFLIWQGQTCCVTPM